MDSLLCYESDSDGNAAESITASEEGTQSQGDIADQSLSNGNTITENTATTTTTTTPTITTATSHNRSTSKTSDNSRKRKQLPDSQDNLKYEFRSSDLSSTSKSTALEVPKEISRMFGTATNDHQGRIRSFPHVVGNFPTFVFIRARVGGAACRAALHSALDRVADQVAGLQPVISSSAPPVTQLSAWPLDFHLSLSRTVTIRAPQIPRLIADLQSTLRRSGRFSFELSRLAVFVNDDRTRTFLAIEPVNATDKIVKCIQRVDAAFVLHDLPKFYQDPKPHVSLAWTLGDKREELTQCINTLFPNQERSGSGIAGEGKASWCIDMHAIECKIGNKIHPVTK